LEILQEKILNGSYTAITGKDRFKGAVLELLRGLLNDNPESRWDIDDALNWLEGNRSNPKQAVRYKKAARPFLFNGEKYLYPATLAQDMDKNPNEMSDLVQNGDLRTWISRALQDKDMHESIEKLENTASSGGRGAGYTDRLIGLLSIGLDSAAPMRFRGRRFMADGVGKALVRDMALGQDINVYACLLESNIPISWLTFNESVSLDISSFIQKFDSCRNFMRQKKPGFGIERCAYILAPDAHCLSEKIKDYLVRDSESFIRACEDLCRRKKEPAYFLDRHSIAFLSYHDNKSIENCLYELGSGESHKVILGNLKCLSNIQYRYDLEAMPGIAKAFLDLLPEVYNKYHDRRAREKLVSGLKRYAAEGNLVKMLSLVNNPELRRRDDEGFKKARKEYASLNKEYDKIEDKLREGDTFGHKTGHDVAAVISSGLAGLIILVMAFMFLSGDGPF